jgi:fructose-bisphosphate aldolase class II
MAAMIRELAAGTPVPVALHLDHGAEFAEVIACIRCGFTDVMLDASSRPYEENASLTRRVVEAAHAVGMGVEAELGHVGQGVDYADEASRKAAFTKPEDAERFVAETGVDALAVAVGSAHGVYRGKPELDLDLLAGIREQVAVPLVLHGGSGISDDDFRAAIQRGISKVNIYTAMSLASTAAIHAGMSDGTVDSEGSSYSEIQEVAQKAIVEVVAHHMEVFGSVGKA